MNKFCLGQVLFDPEDASVIVYGGSSKHQSVDMVNDHFFTRDRGRIHETPGIRRYKPFKTRDGKPFNGHLSKILELETSFSGMLKSNHFDEGMWGLISHTICFIGSVKIENIRDDHVVVENLPGDM